MIGFPKTKADFPLGFWSPSPLRGIQPELSRALDIQKHFFLSNREFSAQKKRDWKYFPLAKLLPRDFLFCEGLAPPLSPRSHIAPVSKAGLALVIQDGRPVGLPLEDEGLFVCSWRAFLSSPPKSLDSRIRGKILESLKKPRDPFCALSHLLFPDGLILVAKKSLRRPLELHYTWSESLKPATARGFNLRNFIFVEPGADLCLFERFHSPLSARPLFLNLQADVFVGKSASLQHIRTDQLSKNDTVVNQLQACLGPKARANFFVLSLQAGQARWGASVRQEADSQSDIKGLSLLDSDTYSDHNVSVWHRGRGGESSQSYRSFLFDSARQVFQGFVSMDREAQKCSARQFSGSFLFGEKASAVACPELDIKADDVKASHGAALSPYAENRELLFYLQSRAVGPVEAFQMIVSSLLEDSLSGLEGAEKKFIRSLCDEKLKSLQPSLERIVSSH